MMNEVGSIQCGDGLCVFAFGLVFEESPNLCVIFVVLRCKEI